MVEFCLFLTELSGDNFQNNSLSISQWSFTKFNCVHKYCGDLLWDCSSANFANFDRVICPRHDNGGVLLFHVLFCLVRKEINTVK